MSSLRRSAALAAGLLFLAACHDGSGTGPGTAADLTVQATASASDPHLGAQGGGQTVACLFTFALTPTGDAGATASWTGGTLRFFVGADRVTPFDSLSLSAAEMNETFGTGIRAGTPVSGGLGFLATIPFGMEGEFRYRVAGSNRDGAAKAYASCLAPVQETGTAPPSVSNLQVAAGPGPVEPGDTIRVSWTAASTTGLWETGIIVSGAFQLLHRVAAAYEKQERYAAEFVVPRNPLLGEPLRVTAYAMDLLVRQGAPLSAAVGPVTDATAPVLNGAGTMFGPGGLGGEFAAGDTLRLIVSAADNGHLSWLVYEAGPVGAAVRDSVPLDPVNQPTYFPRIATRAEWAGEGELRVYVRDAAGNRSGVREAAPGTLRFFSRRPVQTRGATLPYQPADHAVDGARGRVAVARHQQARVHVYSLQTLAEVAFVDLPAPASQVDVAPDGRFVALIPGLRSLSVIDLAGSQPVRRDVALDVVPLETVYGFRIAASGKALVTGRPSGGGVVVVEYDFATGAQRVRTDAPQFPGTAVVASHDRSRLLVGTGCVYRADTDAFGACAALGNGGEIQGSGTGAFWLQYTQVADASLRPYRTLPHPAALLSVDDRYAFVPDGPQLLRVRLSDGHVEDAYGTYLYQANRLSADGRILVSLEMVGATNNQYGLRVIELP